MVFWVFLGTYFAVGTDGDGAVVVGFEHEEAGVPGEVCFAPGVGQGDGSAVSEGENFSDPCGLIGVALGWLGTSNNCHFPVSKVPESDTFL